jgi:hypothetical protein
MEESELKKVEEAEVLEKSASKHVWVDSPCVISSKDHHDKISAKISCLIFPIQSHSLEVYLDIQRYKVLDHMSLSQSHPL